MKKLILSFLFVLGITIQAHATDFNYSGKYAVEDFSNFWFPVTSHTPIIAGLGGNEGFGELLMINTETQIADVNSLETALPNEAGTTTFAFNIYSKSNDNGNPKEPFPDPSSLMFTSQ